MVLECLLCSCEARVLSQSRHVKCRMILFCLDYVGCVFLCFILYRESNLKQLATLEISDGMEPKAIFGKKLVKKKLFGKTWFLPRPQNPFTKT